MGRCFWSGRLCLFLFCWRTWSSTGTVFSGQKGAFSASENKRRFSPMLRTFDRPWALPKMKCWSWSPPESWSARVSSMQLNWCIGFWRLWQCISWGGLFLPTDSGQYLFDLYDGHQTQRLWSDRDWRLCLGRSRSPGQKGSNGTQASQPDGKTKLRDRPKILFLLGSAQKAEEPHFGLYGMPFGMTNDECRMVESRRFSFYNFFYSLLNFHFSPPQYTFPFHFPASFGCRKIQLGCSKYLQWFN